MNHTHPLTTAPPPPPTPHPSPGNTALHFVMDPILRVHNDPERKLASLLLGRGADPKATNLDRMTPAMGVAMDAATGALERTLLAQVGVLMPLRAVARTHLRHQKEVSQARAALQRGTPAPNLAAYSVPPPQPAPWELPEAHPLDRSMLAVKSSLQAARLAARAEAARAEEGGSSW
jgi:hypothetical protein